MSFLPGLWRTWINRSASGPFLNADNLNDMELKFRALDCLGALRAISLVDALPGSPADGDAYLTSAAATPANKIVRRFNGTWEAFTPINGMVAFLADGSAKQFAAGAWGDASFGGGGGSVTSVFGRTGAVTAQAGDYTPAQVGAMAAANPVFTGTLKQDGMTRITSGGDADFASLRVSNLSSAFNGVLTSNYVGGVGVRGAADFRDNYIQAAASDHNHFSKVDVSASTPLGAIDATAIKVTADGLTLTLSGGVDGQGWDIICPSAAVAFDVPSGATLRGYNGTFTGPTTYSPGGGRAIRIVRVDASTWIMPNLS